RRHARPRAGVRRARLPALPRRRRPHRHRGGLLAGRAGSHRRRGAADDRPQARRAARPIPRNRGTARVRAALEGATIAAMTAENGALRIVFDFGGVLFDWRPIALVQRHFPQQARDDASARATVAAVFQGFTGDWAQFDRGLLEADELVSRITARTGLGVDNVQRLVDTVPQSLTPKADTVALLQRLHATGVTLHFLSNMPRLYAEHLDRTHPELMAHFESGVYSAHVQLIKPEEAMYRLASERF